jgi:hypothetical protein
MVKVRLSCLGQALPRGCRFRIERQRFREISASCDPVVRRKFQQPKIRIGCAATGIQAERRLESFPGLLFRTSQSG